MPAVKVYDALYGQELGERVEYERWVLEHFRARLFRQSESTNGVTEITLGAVNERGDLRGRKSILFVSSLSEPAVSEALAPFRVLAFTSAFKLQDMIAEWILEANGEHLWKFSEKLKKYDQLKRAGALHEPPAFLSSPSLSPRLLGAVQTSRSTARRSDSHRQTSGPLVGAHRDRGPQRYCDQLGRRDASGIRTLRLLAVGHPG
jgi:hypothetical protein